MGFRDALQNLGNAIQDLSQLDVKTYTGDVTITFENGSPNSSLEELIANANAAGEIKLVAASTVKVDGDSTTFVASGGIASESLLKAHNAAIESARLSRDGIVTFIAEQLGLD